MHPTINIKNGAKAENSDDQPSLLAAHWHIFSIAVPAILSAFFLRLINLINTIYVGKLGDEE